MKRNSKVRLLQPILSPLLALLLAIAVVPTSPAAAEGPSVVSVERTSDGSYVYLVNGQPEFMAGMGYNAIYRYLPTEERAARYDADFSKMRALGLNTIMGWDADKGYEQDKFDQLTLDKAWEHGLGVVMPFYLPPEGDYEDPAFRGRLKADLAAKVETYKDHAAIRMWGIGNEVIQGVIASPHTSSASQSIGARGQVEAFGQFYLELADMVHELDPNHPIIYREAEDVFLPLLTWYRPEDGIDRPWLLYGLNIYTFRLEQILSDWPHTSNGMPLFITEFAPEGWSPSDRPFGYLKMWEMLRAHPEFVLGAAPYVWTTEGPEPVDRHFGLVDSAGNPTDGSLEALAGVFRTACPAARHGLHVVYNITCLERPEEHLRDG